MKHLNKIIIILFVITIISVDIWYRISSEKKLQNQIQQTTEIKIKNTEKKYNKKIDSILLLISQSEQQRREDKIQIEKTKKNLKNTIKTQKYLTQKYKNTYSKILNSSESDNWIWFTDTFSNIPNDRIISAKDTIY